MFDRMRYWAYLINVTVYFCLNRWRFKSLGFKARIIAPLRLNGTRYMEIGRVATIQRQTWLFAEKIDDHEPSLVIGEGCAIGDFNHITAVRKVHLGKNVLTANRVYISDNLHEYRDVTRPVMHQPVVFKGEVLIGEGTWIGENACVIGAKIGRNCVIGANAVVTHDIPDYCVAAGIPARIIKRYDSVSGTWKKEGTENA